MTIRSTGIQDKEWVIQVLKNLWGSEEMITRGRLVHLADIPGFIAEDDGRKVGLLTYMIEGDECEITSLNALMPGKGIGTALIQSVEEKAREQHCKKLVVITTNDNTRALHFYQKRGFTVAAVRINKLEEYRKLKPQIPLIGEDGIPLRDEIELEKVL